MKPANLEVAPTDQSDDPAPPDVKYDISVPTFEHVSTAHGAANPEEDAKSDDSSGKNDVTQDETCV